MMGLQSATAPTALDGTESVAVIEFGTVVWRAPLVGDSASIMGKRAPVLVRSEDVLVVPVDLPLASHRQRLEAVPFAVEGMLAEPLAKVHVVLGPQIGPKRYLAGVVAHEIMARWVQAADKAGLAGARILPDCLALPRPETGGWTVHATGERVLVRQGDSAGFAVGLAALRTVWQIASCPPIVVCGEPLPAEFLARPMDAAALTGSDPVSEGFDLRQGPYAASGFRGSAALRRVGWIVGCGALILGAVNTADTLALHRLAGEKHDTAQALLTRLMPGSDSGGGIDAQLAQLLPDATNGGAGRFLPLLTQIAEALKPQSGSLAVQSLTFDAADGQLGLEVAAPDLAALQRMEAAMIDAGLRTTSGVATAEQGAAEVRIVVDDGSGASGT